MNMNEKLIKNMLQFAKVVANSVEDIDITTLESLVVSGAEWMYAELAKETTTQRNHNDYSKAGNETALLAAVNDLLQIEEKSSLWDKPGEYWDDGEGYIGVNEARTSPELQSVIARLRTYDQHR